MHKKNLFLFFVLNFFTLIASAQSHKTHFKGVVKDPKGVPIPFVSLLIKELNEGLSADEKGRFDFYFDKKGPYTFLFSHINFQDTTIKVDIGKSKIQKIIIELKSNNNLLEKVEIQANAIEAELGLIKIPTISLKKIPSPFQDFNAILATLPGVVSNNELSSSYSVRGGNFTENLVYVEDMPVYRPLLVRTGQQEGLSFIHPNLVKSVNFSSGGWQAEHGGRMSSMLDIKYKRPKDFGGSVSMSRLGYSANVEGVALNKKLSFLLSARHKRATSLLGSSETKANYRPKFTDLQGFLKYSLSDKTKISLLLSYAKNDYLVEPQSLSTTFGPPNNVKQLNVYYEGRDKYNYDIWQGGVKLTHDFHVKLSTKLIVTALTSLERDKFDVEGTFRLNDLLDDRSENEQAKLIAVKSKYRHGRNDLDTKLIGVENKWLYDIDLDHHLKFGLGVSHRDFSADLEEYNFTEEDAYVEITRQLSKRHSYNENLAHAYVEYDARIDDKNSFSIGLRNTFVSRTKENLLAPRLRYTFDPLWEKNTVFTFSAGIYYQPAFYRELLDSKQGELNLNQKSQSSYHFILAANQDIKLWGRSFKLNSELFYKYMPRIIPFDQENVKLTYYAFSEGVAYAYGADFRLSGEFVKGAESWFSMGLLNTKENVDFDNQEYVRRPTDQRINMSVFFQDYLPNSETFRGYLNANFITSLPFGFPGNVDNRTNLDGKEYLRVDLGVFKYFYFKNSKLSDSYLRVGIEALNVLDYSNIASYTWVEASGADVKKSQYIPAPNRLTERFFNLKIEYSF